MKKSGKEKFKFIISISGEEEGDDVEGDVEVSVKGPTPFGFVMAQIKNVYKMINAKYGGQVKHGHA